MDSKFYQRLFRERMMNTLIDEIFAWTILFLFIIYIIFFTIWGIIGEGKI